MMNECIRGEMMRTFCKSLFSVYKIYLPAELSIQFLLQNKFNLKSTILMTRQFFSLFFNFQSCKIQILSVK